MIVARLTTILSLAVLPVLAAQGQTAQGTEAAYIAARDTAIAKVKKRDQAGGEVTDAQTAQDTRTLEGLESRLRALVGPVAVKGFETKGKINLETLSDGDVGYGSLDALVFAGQGDKGSLYVTTASLLTRWLKGHIKWWEDQPMPQSPAQALKTGMFYTQAISADAAVELYADVPVETPPGMDLAIAQLNASTQDQPPPVADNLMVSVIAKGRLLVATVPLDTAFKPIPACDTIAATYAKRQQKLTDDIAKKEKAGGDSGDSEKQDDPLGDLEKEASAAALKCFAEHAKDQPAFAAAQTQAQALIGSLTKP